MKSAKTWLLIALVPMLFLSGCLTGTIKGQVIDKNDRPIVGAIVSTQPPSEAVRTTEHGYTLKDVPVGEYVVEAEKPGYQKGTAHVRVQWSTTTGADIQLLPEK